MRWLALLMIPLGMGPPPTEGISAAPARDNPSHIPAPPGDILPPQPSLLQVSTLKTLEMLSTAVPKHTVILSTDDDDQQTPWEPSLAEDDDDDAQAHWLFKSLRPSAPLKPLKSLPRQSILTSLEIVSIVTAPIREANLLLPETFDPFATTVRASDEQQKNEATESVDETDEPENQDDKKSAEVDPEVQQASTSPTDDEPVEFQEVESPEALVNPLVIHSDEIFDRLIFFPTEPEVLPRFDRSKQRQLLAQRLCARRDTAAEDAAWVWTFGTGGNFRSGNINTMNVTGTINVERHWQGGDFSARMGGVYNKTGDDEANRRVYGNMLVDHNLRGRWLLFVREELEYDEARLIDLRNVSSGGLGFRFIDELDRRLVVRTGPTMSYVQYAPEADNVDEARSGWFVESEFRKAFSESVRLEWTSSAFPNFDSEEQLRVRNEAAFVFPIGGFASPWRWRVGVKHEYQANPVQTTNAGDVEGYFSVTYSK